jgi:hypothetical protein
MKGLIQKSIAKTFKYRSTVAISPRFCSDEKEFNEDDKRGKNENKQKLKIKKLDTGQKSTLAEFKGDKQNQTEKEEIDIAAAKRLSNIRANEKAILATKVGAMANVGLAASKCVLGLSISSTALVADGISSFGDLLSDGVVYYSVTEARKKATPDRPWGQGKIEPLGTFFAVPVLYLTFLFRCAFSRCVTCNNWNWNWIFCDECRTGNGEHKSSTIRF